MIRNWQVVYLSVGDNRSITRIIEAYTMKIEFGALIFENKQGEVIKAFGPGGWLSVVPHI